MAECNQLTPLPFKGLMTTLLHRGGNNSIRAWMVSSREN